MKTKTLLIIALAATSGLFAEDKVEKRADEAFAVLDKNKDKQVTLDEFRLKKDVPGKKAAEIFEEADANSDGHLTIHEFRRHVKDEVAEKAPPPRWRRPIFRR